MTLQRTVTIPAGRRLHLDFTLPETAKVGPAIAGAISLRASV
jgi:hypothetical protein